MSSARLRRLAAAIVAALCAAPALAQHDDHAQHAAPVEHAQHTQHAPPAAPAHEHSSAEHSSTHAPAATLLPPPTDADRAAAFPDFGSAHVGHEMLDDPLNKAVRIDRLERQDADDGSVTSWNVDTWIGRSLTKLWIRAEGERASGETEHAELELLWGKAFSRWWELVAGARHDFEPGPSRDWATFGVHGLAPYRFEVAATAYLGEGGRSALRVESSRELLITNRLVLQPLIEVDWYGQADRERGFGAGLSDAELALRLRYEIRREVAPYVGIVRERKFGTTANIARANGIDPDDRRVVAGIRLSF